MVRRLRMESLEDRRLLVVGAFDVPEIVPPGTVFDGVVALDYSNSSDGTTLSSGCSGSLLFTGRHILTAGHCVTDGGGNLNVSNVQVVFEMPDRNYAFDAGTSVAPIDVPPAWNGNVGDGADLGIIELPAIAPFPAARYDIYRSSSELNDLYVFAGYGLTGTGAQGQVPGSGDIKRLGHNEFGNILNAANGDILQGDLDDGTAGNNTLGDSLGLDNGEAATTSGDSGAPAFLNGREIAGVNSFTSGGGNFFGQVDSLTRVSDFQAFIDDVLDDPADIVLDMNLQPAGTDGAQTNITLQLDPDNAGRTQLLVNSNEVWSAPSTQVLSITVLGSADDDALTVNYEYGDPVPAGGLEFDGGMPAASDVLIVNGTAGLDTIDFAPTSSDAATVNVNGGVDIDIAGTEHVVVNGRGGSDELTFTSPAGSDAMSYTPGDSPDSGAIRSRVLGSGATLLPLDFTALGAFGEVTFAGAAGGRSDRLEIFGTDVDDRFEIETATADEVQILRANQSGNIFTTVDIQTPGISELDLLGLDGDDVFNIDGRVSYSQLIVQGGSASPFTDVLNYSAAGAITVDVAAATVEDAGATDVDYTGIEEINVDANGQAVGIAATGDDDDIVVSPYDATSGTARVTGKSPVINYDEAGAPLQVDALGGQDLLTVNATTVDDTVDVDGVAMTVTNATGGGVVAYGADTEALTVDARDGRDLINVTPATATAITILGGDPIGRLQQSGGDVLNVITGGAAFAYDKGPEADAGRATVTGSQAVSFDEIELLQFDGTPFILPDDFEPNDTIGTATVLGSLPKITLRDLTLHDLGPAIDRDFFQITAQDTGKLIVNAFFDDNPGLGLGDVDITIWDANGNFIAASDGTTNNAMIVIPVVSQERYYLEVFSSNNLPNVYNLEIENFPAPVPTTVALSPASDSGSSIHDNVTFDDTPTVFVQADLLDFEAMFNMNPIPSPSGVIDSNGAAGADVEVVFTGATTGTTAAGSAARVGSTTLWNFTPGAALPDDLYFVAAAVTITDGQGTPVTGRTVLSEALLLTIDTHIDDPAVAPDLLASSDSGMYDDDNVTSIQSPAFVGTAEPNVKVRVFANGLLVGQGVATSEGNWEITVEPLTDGVFDITVVFEDLAGNVSNPSPALKIEIDTIQPNTPLLDLDDASDTGRHDDDNVTRAEVLAVSITTHDPNANFHIVPDALNSTDYLKYRVWDRFEAHSPNGPLVEEFLLYDSAIDAGPDAVNTAGDMFTSLLLLNAGNSDLSDLGQQIGNAGAAVIGGVLQNGLHNLKVEVEDRAGNISEDFLFDLLIDRVAYLGDVHLHPESDTGIGGFTATKADRITSDNVPSFFGLAEANNIVTLAIDGVPAATTVAVPLDGDDAFQPPVSPYDIVQGNWQALTNLNLSDGEHGAVATFEDLAGNRISTEPYLFFVDTQGPQVENVTFNDDTTTDIFDLKPDSLAPDPLVDSLVIHYIDNPDRTANFLYDPVFQALAEDPGNYTLIGDANGIVLIVDVQLVTVYPGPGVATAQYRLVFAEPLPDDRYTLIVSDSIRDVAGNQLDGESTMAAPGGDELPSGDGSPGGDFVGRFTVDSRAELGVWAAGSVYADTNGNFVFDPEGKDNDDTNEDIVYVLGYTSDNIFAGNFAALEDDPNTAEDETIADGFDKLAAYGFVAGRFRWMIDTDNNGVPNEVHIEPKGINGLPVAGNFDVGDYTDPNDPGFANGDEVGLKDGTTWWLDTDHDFLVDKQINGNIAGLPIVGDFDGDGIDDLGGWSDDTFQLDLSSIGGINGMTDPGMEFTFGFIGVRERPIAADFNGDGVDDIGLWVPDRSGATPEEEAEWYILISGEQTIPDRIVDNPNPGVDGSIVDFIPQPFGDDIYAKLGDEYALPVVGNFDPPVTGNATPQYAYYSYTNPANKLDVDGSGYVSALDALMVIEVINANGSGYLLETFRSEAAPEAPFYDTSGNFIVSSLDVLLIVDQLNGQVGGGGGEGEAVSDDVAIVDLAAPIDVVSTAVVPTAGPVEAVPATSAGGASGMVEEAIIYQPPVSEAGEIEFESFSEEMEETLDDLAGDIAGVWAEI